MDKETAIILTVIAASLIVLFCCLPDAIRFYTGLFA